MSTIVSIPHEKIALELCAELVKRGQTFRCEKTSAGWEFDVVPVKDTANSTQHRGFAIEPKRDFAPPGFLIDGQYVMRGFVVVKDGCNVMPGAAWFLSIKEATQAIDVFIKVDGDGRKFWERQRGDK